MTTSTARARIAEIDAIRNADGAPAPTFAQHVDQGGVSESATLRLAEQWLAERSSAILRAQNGIRHITTNWGSVRTVVDNPDSPYVRDILGGLGDHDREALQRISAVIPKTDETRAARRTAIRDWTETALPLLAQALTQIEDPGSEWDELQRITDQIIGKAARARA